MSPADLRAWALQKSAPLTVHYGRELQLAGRDLPRPEQLQVATRHGAVSCELYRPPDVGRPPVMVHLHGGAFIMRYPRMDDFWARYLVATAEVAVVAVDYATAPQSRYPVAQEQAHDVLAHLADHGTDLGLDGERVGVSGFSAGGNLAASACLQARDRGTADPRFQLLGVPSLDLTQTWAEKRPVGRPMLGEGIVDLVRATYFRDAVRRAEPYASPARAESLAGLAPTMLITAERDLLRPEGSAFAARLASDGVPVEHVDVSGRDHYFLDRQNAPALMSRMAAAVHHSLCQT